MNSFSSSYLGIGMLVSTWLLRTPAQEIVLLGRTGTFTSEVPAELLTHSSAVTALRCDATAAEDVHSAFSTATVSVTGVFHAGGLLQDGILLSKQRTGFERCLFPS